MFLDDVPRNGVGPRAAIPPLPAVEVATTRRSARLLRRLAHQLLAGLSVAGCCMSPGLAAPGPLEASGLASATRRGWRQEAAGGIAELERFLAG